MWDAIYPYVASLLPTAGLLVIAYVVFKTIFEADRKERKAVAEWEAAKAARESIETDSSDGISPPSEKG
ncbi:MAG: hypothetical protein WAR57_07345 [Candidatus Phosphoribacter sp.]|nr:hypothetical protein [Actinomycetales bacterium]